MTHPRITTHANSHGWHLQVVHEGTTFVFQKGKRGGAEDCRRTEVHLERVAAKFGWDRALKAEAAKVDLLDPENAPAAGGGQVEMEGVR